MLAQLGVAVEDLPLRVLVRLRLVWRGGFEFPDGGRKRDRVELAGQPLIEFREQLLFAQVDRCGVAD
jgi:hypothetical protein